MWSKAAFHAAPDANDPYYQSIAGDKRESLKGRFSQLKDEARRAVRPLSAARDAMEGEFEENA